MTLREATTQPNVCLTSAGCLIHEGKVLLIKHAKVGVWLNPGGHIEPGELPHQAAEREFFEETGVKVTAFGEDHHQASDGSHYVPNPFISNLHWVCEENYQKRLVAQQSNQPLQLDPKWSKGCEQHMNFVYLVKPAEPEFTVSRQLQETLDIGWFSRDELQSLDTWENIRIECGIAFERWQR